jgi:hypothetical protein
MPSMLQKLSGTGPERPSLLAEGRFLLTTNPSQHPNHPIKQLPALSGQNT